MEIRAKTVLPLYLLLLYERQMMCGSPNAATLLQKWSEEKKICFYIILILLFHIIALPFINEWENTFLAYNNPVSVNMLFTHNF